MQKKHLYARIDPDDYDWLAEMASKSEPQTSISKYAAQCIKWCRTYKNLIAEMKEAKNGT